MVPRNATTAAPHPDAVEFVRFCYHRRRVGWPELYDEMCAVAGRGLFHGFSADDLGGIGIGFSLFDMPALAGLASRVVAEEVALRRPVSVVIIESDSNDAVTPATTAAVARAIPAVASGAAIATATTAATSVSRLAAPVPEDRSFDVPIRLALAPSGA